MLSIDGFLVKFDFNEAIWVRSDDEIDVAPIGEQAPLDVAHNVGQVLPVHLLQCLVILRCYEVTVQLLAVVNPPCTEHFERTGLVGVVLTQVADMALLFVCRPQVTGERILVLEDRILHRHGAERHFTVEILLNSLASLSLL